MIGKLLEGKNAIITGARRGIGRAIVETFAQNGANIWACIRNEDTTFTADMMELSKEYGVSIKVICFDLLDEAQTKAAMKEIIGEKLPINILINNAGITHRALFQMTAMKTVRDIFEVDFFAPFLITQLVVKAMLKSKVQGSIVNISSTSALDCNGGRSAYGSAKAALSCFSRVLAEELGTQRIRVNSIAPGITDTSLITLNKEQITEIISQTVLKQIGKPQDVANGALFLASELSSFVTGQVLRIDGGLL